MVTVSTPELVVTSDILLILQMCSLRLLRTGSLVVLVRLTVLTMHVTSCATGRTFSGLIYILKGF